MGMSEVNVALYINCALRQSQKSAVAPEAESW